MAKEVVIISGKGGTGKTSLTAAFAALAKDAVLADCDVDAADLHLVLNPTVLQETDFTGGKLAVIDAHKCVSCGKCAALCRFGAIAMNGPGNDIVAKTYSVDPIACEGCKVCVEFCPVGAIAFEPAINGQWFVSQTRFGPMVHARLGIAQENSGKLVTLIRKEAKRIAEEQNKELILIDGSPGIGCPVIASVVGGDLVLIVAEPTVSSLHDLKRVLSLTQNFGVKTMICINKSDLNPQMSQHIIEEAPKAGSQVIGQIPYDHAFTKAQIQRQTIVEYTDGPLTEILKTIWKQVVESLS